MDIGFEKEPPQPVKQEPPPPPIPDKVYDDKDALPLETARPVPVIIQPVIAKRTGFPNVGMQDVIDLFDFFGFDIRFSLEQRQMRAAGGGGRP